MLWSQRDPAYDRIPLGKSNLTVGGYGCFVVSLANLFQRHPLEILKIQGAITRDGYVVSSVVAIDSGGTSLSATKNPPKGWCIAVTNKYAGQGFPTHFLCVNMDTKQQIDPLKYPAVSEPLSYHLVSYRPFTGVKLNDPVATDVMLGKWSEDAVRFNLDHGIMSKDNGFFYPERPVTREELATVAYRLANLKLV